MVRGSRILCNRHRDLLRGDGQFAEPLSGSPVNCMRNGRTRCVDNDFTDGLRTEGAGGFVAVLELDFQTTHILARGNLVLHKVGFSRTAVTVVTHILHQCVADALDDTALSLNGCKSRVYGDTAAM